MATAAVLLAACAGGSSSGSSAPSFDESSGIVVYTRDTTSGTRDGFMNGIGFGPAAKDDSLLVEGFVTADNTAILTAMSGSDKYGIGYVSLSSVNSSVKGLQFEGVAASEETVLDNSYGLKRPFNWMVRAEGDFSSAEVEGIVGAFKAFMGTVEGGEAIAGAGAVSLNSTVRWDDIAAQHGVCSSDNSSVTVRFGGSDSIEKVAKAVTSSFRPRCGNFVAEHEHTGSGDAYKRTVGPQKDEPVGKDVGFSSRPFNASELLVGGEPLDSSQHGQLAWDAIVAIVHLDNPLANVTAAKLRAIYERAAAEPIRTWAEALAE